MRGMCNIGTPNSKLQYTLIASLMVDEDGDKGTVALVKLTIFRKLRLVSNRSNVFTF